MISTKTFSFALVSMAIVGCISVTPRDVSAYSRVGGVAYGVASSAGRFVRDPAFTMPRYFIFTPEQLFEKYGELCRANYNCIYFADDRAYYLLPNYGVVPSSSIRGHAVAIVDGRSGELLEKR